MTSINVIYKIRSQEGVPILARLIEAFYDNDKAGKAAQFYNESMSMSEKHAGWVYSIQEVQIIDTLEEKKDGS